MNDNKGAAKKKYLNISENIPNKHLNVHRTSKHPSSKFNLRSAKTS